MNTIYKYLRIVGDETNRKKKQNYPNQGKSAKIDTCPYKAQ